jgi:hypothetical protein
MAQAVVADRFAAGAKMGKVDTIEILVLLVPLGGMAGLAEILIFLAMAKNSTIFQMLVIWLLFSACFCPLFYAAFPLA